ncbi:hypothetical protein VYA_31840 [Vibrio alfacsensis]|nr:hypothetical protein VYA_31840 [Vibrio alfacsensis]
MQCVHNPYIPLVVIPLRIPIFFYLSFSQATATLISIFNQINGRYLTHQTALHRLILLTYQLKAKYPSHIPYLKMPKL